MQITRRFTREGQDPFAAIEFAPRTSARIVVQPLTPPVATFNVGGIEWALILVLVLLLVKSGYHLTLKGLGVHIEAKPPNSKERKDKPRKPKKSKKSE